MKWPAARASNSDGTNWNSPTSPRSQALPVSAYICQPTATIIIWLAMVPATRARQNAMKTRKLDRGWAGIGGRELK